MQPGPRIAWALAQRLASDPATLGAVPGPWVHLVVSDFVPSRTLTLASLTLASFVGSDSLPIDQGVQLVARDPATGRLFVGIGCPAGGWTWICGADLDEPVVVYGWVLLDDGQAVLLGSGRIAVPVLVQRIGDAVVAGEIRLDLGTDAGEFLGEVRPVAAFSGTPLSGTAPLTVAFTDLSTNAPTSWLWDFGDSGTSTSQNPSHQYANPGTYTVTLTATNAGGSDAEVKTGYVVAVSPYLLRDTFTGANGTALAAHTMDVGGGWTVSGGAASISANAANFSSVTTIGTASADAGAANCTVQGTLTLSIASGTRQGLSCRVTNADNQWRVTVKTTGAFEIVEVNAGVQTMRATRSVTISTGVAYTIAVTLSGSTITATLNGGNQISYGSASLNQTATRHGINSGTVNECLHDNFQVTL